MTMPIWMAFPPEVHSAALSSGPGPGPLQATAEAWKTLSAEYDSAAQELSALLAQVQAGTWQGPSAEAFVTAHVPYLAWLLQNSANSTAAALEHETVVAAYTAALAAMPTLSEIATNHAVHAALEATNFFGVNAIPIALNEIEYLRMWLQAATTMAMYEAVSETALTWTPPTSPPPPIQKTSVANHDAGGGPTTLNWWVTRVDEVANALHTDTGNLSSNPSGAITKLLTDPLLINEVPHWAGESLLTFIPQVPQLTQLSLGLIAPIVSAAPMAALAGLAGLSQPASTRVMPGSAGAAAPSSTGAAATMAPTLPEPTTTPASAPVTAPPSPIAPAPGGVPAAMPPAAAHGVDYPYAVGPPGIGLGGVMSTGSGARDRASEPETVTAAAAAPQDQAARRERRRQGLIDRGHRYEYLDADAPPDTWVSGRGADALGAAGVAHQGRAAGLAALAGDGLGGGPSMPMMPGSWASEAGETDDP